jgi:DNA-binding NarL/FixJ family response regulator
LGIVCVFDTKPNRLDRHQTSRLKLLAKYVVFVLSSSQDENDIFKSYESNVAGYLIKDEMGDGFISIVDIFDGYRIIVHRHQDNENISPILVVDKNKSPVNTDAPV